MAVFYRLLQLLAAEILGARPGAELLRSQVNGVRAHADRRIYAFHPPGGG